MGIYTRPNIVTNGLVMYLDAGNYRSYTSGSANWFDLSKTIVSGSVFNNPTFSINGPSIVFNGSTQYFNYASAISDTMNTIDIWVNMLNTTVGPIIYYGADAFDSAQWTWGMAVFPAGTHGFNETNGTYPTTTLYTEAVNINVWKNFTLVRNDSGNVRMYKNGALVGTKVGGGTTAIRNAADRLYMGKAGSTYINMNLSTVKIYNRALTAQEVAQNYNATKTRFNLT